MPRWFLPYLHLAALCLVALVCTPAHALTPNGRLQIIHMDVGQGDGTVLISPLGEVVLIDDGLYNNTSAPVNQIGALGITHVRHHFASHYHADHIGAISQIVASGVTIDDGWDRASSYASGTYTTYANTLTGKRRTLVKGQVMMLDSLSAHPVIIRCVDLDGAGISSSDENAHSIVLKVSYGEYDESFGGDLTGMAANGGDIESVVGPEMGPIEVYKVHHHGSAYSSNDNWLNATSPKIGVIQTGNGNTYGHPTAAALGRLHAHGVHTYWNETGAGGTPDPAWDKVASGQVIIQATWEPGGVDTIRGNGFTDTFTNSGSPLDGIPPVVSALAPAGGETVPAGGSWPITWGASDNIAVVSVDLDYSLDDGSQWTTIATGLANTGTFTWTVPNTPSPLARVRVTARDQAGNATTVAGLASFSIADLAAPVVHLLSPNGGESYGAGSTQLVQWQASDNVGVDSVDVDFSLGGALGPWLPLAHGIAGADSTWWIVPDSGTDNAMLRVTAYDHALNLATDLSDQVFQVIPSSVLGAPAAGAAVLSFAPPEPNPSQDRVTLRFSLPVASETRLELLDVSGRRMWSWGPVSLGPGEHRVPWDGRLNSGSRAGLGLYWIRLSGPFGVRTVKLLRLN